MANVREDVRDLRLGDDGVGQRIDRQKGCDEIKEACDVRLADREDVVRGVREKEDLVAAQNVGMGMIQDLFGMDEKSIDRGRIGKKVKCFVHQSHLFSGPGICCLALLRKVART